MVAAITTVQAQIEAAHISRLTTSSRKTENDSGKASKQKSPDFLALLLMRNCKRADVLLKPHHVEELYTYQPLEFEKEMIKLKVRAARFWKLSMNYDYTEEEDSRDDTVQDDRKFIELRTLVDNLRQMFVKQSVLAKSVRDILTKTCTVQVECKEHMQYIEGRMEKIDNYNELANAFNSKEG